MASLSLEEIQRSKPEQTLQSPWPSGRAALPKRAHPRGPKLRRLHCNSRRDITLIHYLLQPALGGVHYLPGGCPRRAPEPPALRGVFPVPAAPPPLARCGVWTLSDPKDCSPPGSSINGIFQARALEWGAIAFPLCALSIVYCSLSWEHTSSLIFLLN